MARLAALLALLFVGVVAREASAVSSGCLPTSLPSTPGAPSFVLTVVSSNPFSPQTGQLELWRDGCQDSDEVVLMVRATALTVNPFLCGTEFFIVQGGIQYYPEFLQTLTSRDWCGTVPSSPTTFVLGVRTPLSVLFDTTKAFTLTYFGGFPNVTLHVPAAGPPPPAITLHTLGCITCHPGDTLGSEIHATNPGGPLLVELKTGARLPDGSVVTILGRHAEEVLAAGTSVIPIFAGFVVPPGIPAGMYTLEAAILEPELGVVLSRSRVTVAVP
jgi:hypothetical protein